MAELPSEIRPALREYLLIILGPVQEEMRETRAAIQELASGLISQEQLNTLKYQVASISEQLMDLEGRTNSLTRLVWAQLILGWTLVIVVLTLLVAGFVYGT